jgi:hypothetical protein
MHKKNRATLWVNPAYFDPADHIYRTLLDTVSAR